MARKTTENKSSSKSKSTSSGGTRSGSSKKSGTNTTPLNTSVKKTQAQIANTRTSQEVFEDNRNRLIGHWALIVIMCCMSFFMILTYGNADGSFLHFLKFSITGLFGFAYYPLPFLLIHITFALIARNDPHALRKSVFIILSDFFFSAMLQTLCVNIDFDGTLTQYLLTSGQNLKSGGLLPGYLAHALISMVGQYGALFVCALLMLVCFVNGFGIRIDLFLNRRANKKREDILRKQEQLPLSLSSAEIDTSDDLRVLLTPSRSAKQESKPAYSPQGSYDSHSQNEGFENSAPIQRTAEERASFDVSLDSEPSQKKSVKKEKKKRFSQTDSENNYELITNPSFSVINVPSRNEFDIPIGGETDSEFNHGRSAKPRKSEHTIDPEQTSIDDMLVFAHTMNRNKDVQAEQPEPFDPDLPFVSSKTKRSKLQVSQAASQWDMDLGNPVDNYTSQVQELVYKQNGMTAKPSETPSPAPAPKSETRVKKSAQRTVSKSEKEITQEPETDSVPIISTAAVISSVFEPSAPVIASPTESEIEAGAKQAKKSGSMNKGEAEAAEAMVSMEIAEGESAEAGTQYHFPPMQILTEAKSSAADNTAEMREKVLRLEATLKSFGIDIKVENVVRGPSVTRYEMELKPGTKMSRITSLNEDIALSLGVASVRVAAVPGKSSTIGIEVPNTISTSVPIRSVMDSKEFRNAKSNLAFAVGKDISGEIIIGDIAKMPHLLIAGTTGSGKSVCMNSIIVSLLYRTKPEQCRMIMIDPKVVELSVYNGIPHLLIPVVTDAKKAAGALQWAVTEMERRYNLLAEYNVRDLAGYNKQARQRSDIQPLPQIVVIIDELADLMLVAAKEVENSIVRIAQKARAAGMHLVIATQRPSANVITGLMKANIPSRIAFAVSSAIDSRIILDASGAEKLLGKGDMLFAPIGSGSPKRVQGCFITDDEVESVVSAVRESGITEYDDSISAQIENTSAASAENENESSVSTDDYDGDPQFAEAVEVVLDTKQASVSMLQRRLRLGYAHAARIVDEMEEKGIVGPFEGSKPRQLRITREQWNTMVGINPNAKPQSSVEDTVGMDADPDSSDF